MENESKIKTFQICRTCTKEIIDTSVFLHLNSALNTEPTIRQKLSDCIPELDLHITPSALICNKCVDMINIMHKFKNECLRSEIQIHKYIQQVQYSGDIIDFVDVVQYHQLCMEFKTELHEITEDVELKDFKNDVTTSVCDADVVKEEDECMEIVKQEYACNYSISTAEDTLDKCDKSTSVQNCLLQVVDDQNDNIQKFCKNDVYYECFTCGYKAKSKLKLILHLKIHKSKKVLKCSFCEYSCTHKNRWKKHMRIHTEERPFKCSICEYRSLAKPTLTSHMRIHTGEKPFKCSICEYSSTHKSNLKFHIMQNHTGEKPFKCSFCGYSSTHKSNLKYHIQIHTGEKPFKCSLCEYSCIQKSKLKNHMCIHTGEKPFKCSMCKYSCVQKSILKTHMCIHTGERPFKCSFCEYSSIEKRYLQTHMRVHTGEKPLKCSI